MKHMKLAAGLLSLAVSVGIGTNAFADVVQKTVTMDQSATAMTFQDVQVGDTLYLTLVNPTNQTLLFQTNQRLGNELSWSVPPHSSRTITYTYAQPFDQNVQFMVVNPTGGNIIAQGLMLPGRMVSTTVDTITSPFGPNQVVTSQGVTGVATDPDRGYLGNLTYNMGNGLGNIAKSPFALVAGAGEAVVDTVALAGRGLAQVVSAPFGAPLERSPQKLQVVQTDNQNQVIVSEEGLGNDVRVSVQPTTPTVAVVPVTQGSSAVTMAPSTYRETITLQPGVTSGELDIAGLNVGDQVVLTLVNPTNQPMRFETTERLGNEISWIVPANSQRVISFTYDQPFQNDVEYVVSAVPSVTPTATQPMPQQGSSAVRGYW